MFGEDDHGTETRGEFPNEAGVDGEPFDVAFVAAIKEDWAHTGSTDPVIGVDEIALLELGKIIEAEMIKSLMKISGLVSVLLSEIVLGFWKP